MGTGIFTKALDDALLAGEVDLAVHSMKDVPTQLLEPMEAWAVLERGLPGDVLVGHNPSSTVVATGSIRRKAQWLHRHPDHTSVGLRGNVETRLAKVKATLGAAASSRPQASTGSACLKASRGWSIWTGWCRRLPRAASWWWACKAGRT